MAASREDVAMAVAALETELKNSYIQLTVKLEETITSYDKAAEDNAKWKNEG